MILCPQPLAAPQGVRVITAHLWPLFHRGNGPKYRGQRWFWFGGLQMAFRGQILHGSLLTLTLAKSLDPCLHVPMCTVEAVAGDESGLKSVHTSEAQLTTQASRVLGCRAYMHTIKFGCEVYFLLILTEVPVEPAGNKLW
jgi:hypothetical protein